MLIESMIQEMGGRQSQTFIRMLNNGYTEEMHQAAYLLFIYLTFIKQADDEQIALWRDVLLRAGLSPELHAEHTEAALFYFAELDIDAFELAQFRRAYNERFNREALAPRLIASPGRGPITGTCCKGSAKALRAS